jgi:hypothetical protein
MRGSVTLCCSKCVPRFIFVRHMCLCRVSATSLHPYRVQCTQTVFHSAGREDSDVRMLGSGRPFVVELVNSFVRPDDLEATAEV